MRVVSYKENAYFLKKVIDQEDVNNYGVQYLEAWKDRYENGEIINDGNFYYIVDKIQEAEVIEEKTSEVKTIEKDAKN